ncbi:hypothetical protein F8M41_025659 [Gigaspora margarita]|uniref:Uncharacterized protein n=1 Tax=Gigaspora margarita TaxID=4874 RepID=A0A8H3XIX1_GIGMA|nr:hypothetical protein F8M41_025659 [Gigaspora margarita]
MDLPTAPTAWDVNNKSTLLNVDANGLNVVIDIGDELIKDKWVKNILANNLKVLENLLEIKPDDTLTLRYRAETPFMLKKYDGLYDDINNLLKVDENNEWALEVRNVIVYRSV